MSAAGVLVLGGHSTYSLPKTRADAIATTVPLVAAAPGANQLANELEGVLGFCCAR